MARSKYVYTVTSAAGVVQSAFTVKHELIRWLSLTDVENVKHGDYWVQRSRDGGTPKHTKLWRVSLREFVKTGGQF